MATEKGNPWPNRKSDYELRDVIGEQLYICNLLKLSNLKLLCVVTELVIYFQCFAQNIASSACHPLQTSTSWAHWDRFNISGFAVVALLEKFRRFWSFTTSYGIESKLTTH